MADNSVVQTIKDAEIDARSLSEFISKDASFKVTRRLAPTIHTLDYYLFQLNLHEKAVRDGAASFNVFKNNAQSQISKAVSDAQADLQKIRQDASGTVSYIEQTVRNAIDTTAIENSPISDALVTVDNSVSQRTINKGLDSVADLPTINNPKDGLRVYVKSYHLGLGRGGGYFTYDSTKSAINNSGTVINGWVKDYADRVTPYCFGVRDDEADVAANTTALQMFFDNICDDTQDYNYDISCNTFINEPVSLIYTGTKELEIPGRLSVRVIEDIKDVSKPYAIHISGVRKWNFTGGFDVNGYTNFAGIKNLIHGVMLSRFRGGTINYIGGTGLEGFAVFYDSETNNNMSTVNEISGSNCGRKLNMRAKRAYTFISNNSEAPTSGHYRTNIKIDFDELEQHLLYTTMLQIGGKLHVVMDYDASTKIASIYPGTLDGFDHPLELDFLYGGALYLRGKDSGEMSYQRLTATNCGICHADRALYGSVGNRLTVQHSSIAYLVGNAPSSVGGFGSQINQPYFENTDYDLVSMSAAGGSVITSPIGLHMDRCTELVPPATKENPLSKFILIGHVTATVGVGNFMNSTTVTTRTWSGGLEEIRTPEKVFLSASGNARERTLVLSMKHQQVVSMGLNSREVVFFGASGGITIKSDDGYLVNGKEFVTIPAGFIPDGTMLKAVMFGDSKNWSLYFYEPQSSGIRDRISDNSKTDFIKRYHSSRSVSNSLSSAFTITPSLENPAFVDINAVVKFRDALSSNGFIKLKAVYKESSEGGMAWELLENYSSAEGSADIQIDVNGSSIDILARRGLDTASRTLYLEGSTIFSNCSIDALQ